MISFVYFDLGGVIEKDFSATKKWDDVREELGIKPSAAFNKFWADVERDICTKEEVDSLLPILQKKFNAKFPANYSLLHTFVKRFERNESIWNIAKTIAKQVRVGLLTNMYPGMLDAIVQTDILPKITWDVIIDSSKVGCMKPDRKIFSLAQQKAGVMASEILFVENNKKNIDAAKSFGWQTFFYDSQNYKKSSKDLANYWYSTLAL